MLPAIPGVDAILAWFDRWPTFHDAEILSVHLNRGGRSMIRIHTWNLSDKVDAAGHFIREREAIVVFEFQGIKAVRLTGQDADVQNVIQGLSVERVEQGWRFELSPSYGLAGEMIVEEIAVRVEPGR